MADHEADADTKLAHFQDVTGVDDIALSLHVLEAHNWDLHAAVSTMMIDNVPSESNQRVASPGPALAADMDMDWDHNNWPSGGDMESDAGFAPSNASDDLDALAAAAAQPLQRVHSGSLSFAAGLGHSRFSSAHYEGLVPGELIEGPGTPDELAGVMRGSVDDQSALLAARVEEEERRVNRRLREKQDAAFQAALQEDQEKERRLQEGVHLAAKAAAEQERKRKEEEEAAAQAAAEAAEREAALERRRKEKAAALGAEPEKGPEVTQVVVRLPNGERKERRFHNSTTVRSLYDFVDSVGSFHASKYSLITNFPRKVYGPDMLQVSLKDAALHPHANLFVLVEES